MKHSKFLPITVWHSANHPLPLACSWPSSSYRPGTLGLHISQVHRADLPWPLSPLYSAHSLPSRPPGNTGFLSCVVQVASLAPGTVCFLPPYRCPGGNACQALCCVCCSHCWLLLVDRLQASVIPVSPPLSSLLPSGRPLTHCFGACWRVVNRRWERRCPRALGSPGHTP